MSEGFRLLVARTARLAMGTVLLFALAPGAQSGPTQSQSSTNLLTNDGFESFTGGLADGWTKWWFTGDSLEEPDYQQATGSGNVHEGSSAQRVASKPARKHHGGVYQQVSTGITAGDAVSLSMWYNWPDDPHDWRWVKVWVGIDPYGGTDPNSPNVTWTADGRFATDLYQRLDLATTAMNSTVTVFARSESGYATTPPSYVLWDTATLTSDPWQYVHLPVVMRNYVPPCTLVNGSFEGDYVQVSDGTRVASHWTPWWNEDWDPVMYHNAKPEYNETTTASDPAYRIRSGAKSQQYGTNWKHYQGGVYQQLTGCPIGTTLRFSAYGLGYAARDIPSSVSDSDGDLQMKVGIDPTGGTDFGSGNVVWSGAGVSLDTYGRFEVTATVQSSTVTVFLHSEPLHEPIIQWFHNTSYWDDATLERLP